MSTDAPVTPPPSPKKRLSLPLKLLIGCGGLVALAGVAGIIALIALTVAIERGVVPDTVALPAGKIPQATIDTLRRIGAVEPGEEVLYFYSASLLSIEGDGNLFTDRRVISYQEGEGGLDVYSATYDQIDDLTFENGESWLDDSTITVYTKDGDWFVLLVGGENGRDDDFFDKLSRRWKSARAE